MMISTDGMVIREQVCNDNDRYVYILTRDLGVVCAFAKGSKSYKSRLMAATQLFCYSKFELYKGRDKYSVNSAECIDMFFEMRDDVVKVSLAQYFSEIVLKTASDESPCEELLKLFLNTLKFLSKNKFSNPILKSIFELRIMSIIGFMPNLINCNNCGCVEVESAYIFPTNGIFFCNDCISKNHNFNIDDFVLINSGVLAALRHIVYSEPVKLFSFTIGEDSVGAISSFSEKYILAHVGFGFKTLDFYKNISS